MIHGHEAVIGIDDRTAAAAARLCTEREISSNHYLNTTSTLPKIYIPQLD